MGKYYTCVVSTSNEVKCWGINDNAQLGLGDTTLRPNVTELSAIDLGTDFSTIQIAAGNVHTCALSTDNKVKCWGYNASGELGYGDTDMRGIGAGQMGNNLTVVDLGYDFLPQQLANGIGDHSIHTCVLS
eukprot:787769_1